MVEYLVMDYVCITVNIKYWQIYRVIIIDSNCRIKDNIKIRSVFYELEILWT